MFEEVINYLFREHSVMNVSPLLNNSFVRLYQRLSRMSNIIRRK